LLVFSASEAGGAVGVWRALNEIDPALVSFMPQSAELGITLYLLGFVAGGLGVLGQPHVIVRTLAIRAGEITRARWVYFAWYLPFSAAAVLTGLCGRVVLPDLTKGLAPEQAAEAAEKLLPVLAQHTLPSVWLGILVAGVFAATMSTADSQFLACSAALTQDMMPRWRASYWASKGATLLVASLAITIALTAGGNVFGLVLGAWSALGATLGPLLIVRSLGLPLPPQRALAMMALGFLTQFFWVRGGLSDHVFELLPGMLAPLFLYARLELIHRLSSGTPCDAGARAVYSASSSVSRAGSATSGSSISSGAKCSATSRM
jgi:sodium/proline symporter